MIVRFFRLPQSESSALLCGPRGTGKSRWVRHALADCWVIDLLQSDVYLDYAARPSLLRERCLARRLQGPVVVDEIQELPHLLDEMQWLIDNQKIQFVATSSNPRKLNPGRLSVLEMRPLTLQEVVAFSPWDNLKQLMVSGLMPSHFLSADPCEELRFYVGKYLKEQVSGVQNVAAFSTFLRTLAVANGELLNHEDTARAVGVSAKVTRTYFALLEESLWGFRLSPSKQGKERRLVKTEKFYLCDVGLASWLAGRKPEPGTPEFAQALHHLILLELMAYRSYRKPNLDITFWRTAGGREVDFLVDERRLAIEVKASAMVYESDLKELTALREEAPVGRRVVVSLSLQPGEIKDRFGPVSILPLADFVAQLWADQLV